MGRPRALSEKNGRWEVKEGGEVIFLSLRFCPHASNRPTASKECRWRKLAPFKRLDSCSVSSELFQAGQALRFAAVDEVVSSSPLRVQL